MISSPGRTLGIPVSRLFAERTVPSVFRRVSAPDHRAMRLQKLTRRMTEKCGLWTKYNAWIEDWKSNLFTIKRNSQIGVIAPLECNYKNALRIKCFSCLFFLELRWFWGQLFSESKRRVTWENAQPIKWVEVSYLKYFLQLICRSIFNHLVFNLMDLVSVFFNLLNRLLPRPTRTSWQNAFW